MTSWTGHFYSFIAGVVLLVSFAGLWFTAVMPGIDRWNKKFFLSYFGGLMLVCIFILLEFLTTFLPVPFWVFCLVLVLESVLLCMPIVMQTVYLLHCSGESIYTSRLIRIILGLWAVYAVIVIISPFHSETLIITAEKQYFRGPAYAFSIMPVVLITLINIAGTMQRRNQLSRKTFLSFLIAMVPIALALIIQMFLEVFPLIDIAYVLSGMTMYGLILSDQVDRDLRRQREIAQQQVEIANQRANIMVLQMRPHFIYNTMTSIYCLCGQDPDLAKKVIMDFTSYLRKNFTAIASDTMIPFESELEHTRAYLAVEQAQYTDSLFVDYDTPHTFFRVPPLTLQPIVENAVVHGRDPFAGPFHISIRTRKTDSGSEIVVADNGSGFEPVDDSEPHLALNNIRQRLNIMCGGSLSITPNEDGGTIVTITIPDSGKAAAGSQ